MLSTNRPPLPLATQYVLLAGLAALLYTAPAAWRNAPPPPGGHFVRLADALLHGELSFDVSQLKGLQRAELIPAREHDRAYCAYPPLPAVILLPSVLLFGPLASIASTTRLLCVINVLLFHMCLARLPSRLGLRPFSTGEHWAMTCLFAFGAAPWSIADMGGDWHLAHAVALSFMLLALFEHAARGRPIVIGALVGLAMLSRPTTAFTALFFVLPWLRMRAWRSLAQFSCGPAVALAVLGAYNAARFGSVFDFAYDRMYLMGPGEALMRNYGQFHYAYVPRNFFWYFLAPPAVLQSGRFPWLGYDQRGMSLFVATPAFLYMIAAVKNHWRMPTTRDAMVSIAACLVPLLLYFNSGFIQFGHRFSMDYLPMLLVLMVIDLRNPIPRAGYVLIVLSIMIHAVALFLQPAANLGWEPPLLAN